jgi:hypothetical protein
VNPAAASSLGQPNPTANATAFIGFFYLLTFVLGFGAMVLVGQDRIRAVDAGGNMAAPLLAEVVGGTPFLGFIAAVAFATILAVVAGLTLSGAAALSHDLWVNVVRDGHASDREQFRVARASTLVLGALAIVLGIAFQGQNVAFMVGLAFAIATSAKLSCAGARDVLAAVLDSRRGGEHARRYGIGARAHLLLADRSGWCVGTFGGAVSAEQSRLDYDSSVVLRRRCRVARDARARGGSEVPRARATAAPRRSVGYD